MENNKTKLTFSIINSSGKPVIKLYSNDDAPLSAMNVIGKDLHGCYQEILNFVYDGVCEFHGGFARVKRGDFYGYVDLTLTEQLRTGYSYVSPQISEDFAVVCSDNKYGYFKMTGKNYPYSWTDLEYDEAFDFCNGMGRVKKNGLFGYISNSYDNKNAIPCIYEEARDFDKKYGYAIVKYNGKYGMIDKSGNWKVEPIFDTCKKYSFDEYDTTIGDKEYFLTIDGTYEEVEYEE